MAILRYGDTWKADKKNATYDGKEEALQRPVKIFYILYTCLKYLWVVLNAPYEM